MGKISHEPKKIKKEEDKVIEVMNEDREANATDERYSNLIENIDSVKPVGDVDCNYIMYLEDYVYTYIYQYATLDLSIERAAVIVGRYYPDTKENIICGILPVSETYLRRGEEWINNEAIDSILLEKEKYFPDTIILGWLHMQPGYGTMVTTREIKVHEELFNREGSMLLLVDPINKIETFYVYEQNDLKEQTGYYIYYDKNPCMQRYMLDNPFIRKEKERVDDAVVTKFRERGNRRKKEYEQKQKANVTVVAACIGLLAIAAVIASRNQPTNPVIPTISDSGQVASEGTNSINVTETDDVPAFIIQPDDKVDIESTDGIISAEDLLGAIGEGAQDNEMLEGEDEIISEEVTNSTENSDNSGKEDIIETEGVVEGTDDEEDYIIYTVKSGDTLRKISFEHYQTELRTREIIEINNIENGDLISPGQVLKLPTE